MNTPLENKLLQILQTSGSQWLNHRRIAEHLGRQRQQLTAHDKRVLRRLLRKGVVEVSDRPSSTRGCRENIYRIKEEFV
jgi:SOS response regulatory protein OraA/RecX